MSDQFVSVSCHHPNTNGLGKTQRGIVEYLATAPGGFAPYSHRGDSYRVVGNAYRAEHNYSAEADRIWHGLPIGVRIREIAEAVYAVETPTAAQIRVVQRGVRRLETLGLVDCWHACAGYVERPYVDVRGKDNVMPQAVAALFVALRWECEHIAEQDWLVAEHIAELERRIVTLTGDELIAALFVAGGAA